MGFSIRNARLEDVEKIVSIHLEAFKGFFLTQLGESFLRLYYSSFLQNPQGIVLCALIGDEVVGFSACSAHPGVEQPFTLLLAQKFSADHQSTFSAEISP